MDEAKEISLWPTPVMRVLMHTTINMSFLDNGIVPLCNTAIPNDELFKLFYKTGVFINLIYVVFLNKCIIFSSTRSWLRSTIEYQR